MTIARRNLLAASLPLLAVPALLRSAQAAQGAWAPTRPMRMVVPFTPGGATDLTARIVSERMAAVLGQPVVVENRPGAGGNVGTEMVARAEPDGHTLLTCTIGTASINQFLYSRLPYKPEDLASVALVNLVANGIVVPLNSPFKTFQDMVAFAKKNPGKLNYGTPGNGTSGHLCCEFLKTRAGIDLTHVPYRGTGAVIPDLLGGNIDLAVDNLPGYIPHVREGRLRLLAVTSRDRWFALPDAPSVQEAGVQGFEAVAWFGVQAPVRTPKPVLERISAVILDILKEPATIAKLKDLGSEPRALGPTEFDAFIKAENDKWREVVKASGAKLD